MNVIFKLYLTDKQNMGNCLSLLSLLGLNHPKWTIFIFLFFLKILLSKFHVHQSNLLKIILHQDVYNGCKFYITQFDVKCMFVITFSSIYIDFYII